MGVALPIILGIIDGAFKLLANHLGRPAGWVPTPQDWVDLQAQVNDATPEAVKAQARARLIASGVSLPPEQS